MIEKTPNGRFRARLKSGRQFVTSRTFDTKREASDWLARERASLAGGVDPRTGRRLVRALLEEWLIIREFTVAAKTYRTDQALQRLVPTGMQAMQVAAVSEREVARSFETLIQGGLSERSVVRYRASLSSFFAWCVREKIIVRNPVTGTKVPPRPSSRPPMSGGASTTRTWPTSYWCSAGRGCGGARHGPCWSRTWSRCRRLACWSGARRPREER